MSGPLGAACGGRERKGYWMARGIQCDLADWRTTLESTSAVDMWILVIVGGMKTIVGHEWLRVDEVVIPK